MAVEQIEIVPLGRFSLRAAAGFGFGPNEGRPGPFDGAMRLAFAVDPPVGGPAETRVAPPAGQGDAGGDHGYAGVVLRQEVDDGPVIAELDLSDGADAEAAVRQASRIVSLDHDGRGFEAVGDRDPVLGRLQRAHPGQRPVLFHSPYEAAAWSVISARRPAAQAAATRRSIARELGREFRLAGQPLSAFPGPERLLEVEPGPGLPEVKVDRLHGIARAARAGELDVAHLHRLGPERAFEEVQRLSGIGPFYAGLIVLRGSGFADAMLNVPERKGLAHIGHYYGLGRPPDLAELTALAEDWRPFRTWAIVLIRLAGDRGTP